MSNYPHQVFQTEDFKPVSTPPMSSWVLTIYNYKNEQTNLPHVFDDRQGSDVLYRAALWGTNWSEEDLVWHKEYSWYYWATDRLDNKYELRLIEANTSWSRDPRHGQKA